MNSKSGELIAKFGAAVRRRLHPNGPLHPKQAAHIAGCSLNTFMRWWRGESRIPAAAVGNLARFFARTGDAAFLAEVYGLDPASRDARLDAELAALKAGLARLESELRGAGDAAMADRAGDVDAEPAAAAGAAAAGEGRALGGTAPAMERQVSGSNATGDRHGV